MRTVVRGAAVAAVLGVGRGCKRRTDAGPANLITSAQAAGAQASISFGGAAGSELALTCKKVPQLTAAYQAVIDRFGVTSVDFDVEGPAASSKGSIKKRFQAIVALEAANPALKVSLTLAVTPSGLDRTGVAVLKAAVKAGARIDVVNIMAMDYGPAMDMAAAATSAAQGTLTQVRAKWPAATSANLGITPMIGQNDSPAEVFSKANATTVRSFAVTNGIGRLAFWSLNRDRACGAGSARASGACSGVAQSPFDFTTIFVGS